MKGKIIIGLICLPLAIGCSSNKGISERALRKNQRDGFVHFYKVQAFCSCLEHAYSNKEIIRLMEEEDMLGSYDQLANDLIQAKIDSLSKKVADSIKPETYTDFENKKYIINACLNYYESRMLDSVAKAEYDSRYK